MPDITIETEVPVRMRYDAETVVNAGEKYEVKAGAVTIMEATVPAGDEWEIRTQVDIIGQRREVSHELA